MFLAETKFLMNLKLASTLSALALALVAYPTQTFAKAYTPTQFSKELQKRLGNKTNAGAYNAAASFLKLALTDTKNKKFAVNYITTINKELRTPVSNPNQPKATTAIGKALTTGYFTKFAYDIDNKVFVAALKKALTFVKGNRRTTANAKKIAAPILAIVKQKGGNAPADINFVNGIVYRGLGQTPPKPVS